MGHLLFFYLFGGIALLTAFIVIVQPNPMYSVLSLIATFGALAALYILLGSVFAAVVQVIIYAGAIMVLFLFVVMLLNVPREEYDPQYTLPSGGVRVAGVLLAALLVVELSWALAPARRVVGSADELESVAAIGRVLFTRYAFPFEATSVLILVALIGAVVLAKRKI